MSAAWSKAAEQAVIGGSVLSPSLLADVIRIVDPSDFFHPAHRDAFAAIEARFRAGDSVDPTVVADDIANTVTDATVVVADCITAHSSSQATMTHARTVGNLAAVRRIESIATDALVRIRDDGYHDPASLLDTLEADLRDVDLPNDPRPVQGLWAAADLIGTDFPEPPWIAEGLLRESWRLLFVGIEGGGKSTMLRQIVTGIASGRHPFTFAPMRPHPALIVDCENPESVVRDGLKRMSMQISDADLTVLCRPGGIDVRQRRDRDLLHRVFAAVQPKVAAIGPLYKLYRQAKGEPDEHAAIAAQNVLDELRIAHGTALVLETHAPKGGVTRELIPFGSSAWMRWPELGWKLVPCQADGTPDTSGGSVKIGRFRGDRVVVDLPAWFDRDDTSPWPWNPYWPHGIPKHHATAAKERTS